MYKQVICWAYNARRSYVAYSTQDKTESVDEL